MTHGCYDYIDKILNNFKQMYTQVTKYYTIIIVWKNHKDT